ncbi:MAG: exonuclease domain-containing protein [Ruminococcaceae bacterium]|nr:exonuclease domain-containing protein [Oscillospiraceae bacterium]
MDYIIFDLEWSRNIRHVIPKCPDEIIQIGAVKYDKNLQYKGSFNRFIKPGVYRSVDAKVAEITGITKEHLERFGVPFNEAFREFKAFMGREYILLSWGPQDVQVLRVNAQYYNKKARLTFMQHFADLQRYASLRLREGDKQQMGLQTAADLCQIDYDPETLHDAHVDAEISGQVFAKIFEKKSFAPFVTDASKPKKAAGLKESEAAKEQLEKERFVLSCPECGKILKNKRGWFSDGRNFFAFMRCKACKREVFTSVEAVRGRDGRPRYKRRLRFVDRIKGL